MKKKIPNNEVFLLLFFCYFELLTDTDFMENLLSFEADFLKA